MPVPVRITEADLRAAMRDPRYWRSGHPERHSFAGWVSKGWQALYANEAEPQTSVWVRAYVRDGHAVAAHWRAAPAPGNAVISVQGRGSVPPDHVRQRGGKCCWA